MGSSFCLPGSPDKAFALYTGRRSLRILSKLRGFVGKTLFECFGLFETTPHGDAPLFGSGGSATGDHITDKCHEPGGDELAKHY